MKYKVVAEVSGDSLDELVDGLNTIAFKIDEGAEIDNEEDRFRDTFFTVIKIDPESYLYD